MIAAKVFCQSMIRLVRARVFGGGYSETIASEHDRIIIIKKYMYITFTYLLSQIWHEKIMIMLLLRLLLYPSKTTSNPNFVTSEDHFQHQCCSPTFESIWITHSSSHRNTNKHRHYSFNLIKRRIAHKVLVYEWTFCVRRTRYILPTTEHLVSHVFFIQAFWITNFLCSRIDTWWLQCT